MAYSGVTSESRTAAQLRNAYKDLAPRVDFNSQNELGYPILYQNVTAGDILLMNYYDYYDFLDKFAFCDSLQYRTMNGYDEKYVNASYPQHSAKGLLTGTMARTLDGVGTSLVKSVYYDHHGNVIQSHERNHRGGYDHNYMHLTFTGKPLTVLHQHSTDSCTVSDLYSYTYDHMERLLTTSLSHDGAAAVTLSSNTYDELGRLDSCAMNNGGHGATVAYTYNVRGWVQSVVNNHFYEWLHYQDAPSGGTPCYNGNISGITWLQRESLKAATSAESQYSFSYDGLNRLSRADYCCESDEWNGNLLSLDTRDFSCSYSYDLNGNMTKLQRKGVNYYNTSLPTHMYKHDTIDNLQLTYNGNQLTKVEDQCVDLTYAGAMDFKDGATKATEYTYDANGNMTSDRNKGISSIAYNMLNLPQTVLFEDGHETCYTYAADGRKLRVEYRLNNFSIVEAEKAKASDGYDAIASPSALDENGIIETPAEPISRTLMTRDYCGNYIYKNGCLERVMTENGYMQDGGLYFYIKDYQGNVRVVLNQANQPVEVNSYYPYGGLMAATTTEGTQPYKYGTKELDRENGLDWYDFLARQMDPMVPRFTTIDPKCEKYYAISPYAYCADNPVKFVDPTGKWIVGTDGKPVIFDNVYRWSDNIECSTALIIHNMRKTSVGLGVLDAMIKADYPITLSLNNMLNFDPSKKTRAGMAETTVVQGNDGLEISKVEIKIFKNVIETLYKNQEMFKESSLTVSDIIGIIAVHEGTHATNKRANSKFVSEADAEKVATEVEQKAAEERKKRKAKQ